jgi:hypothetical protein
MDDEPGECLSADLVLKAHIDIIATV